MGTVLVIVLATVITVATIAEVIRDTRDAPPGEPDARAERVVTEAPPCVVSPETENSNVRKRAPVAGIGRHVTHL
jgi:hypothetical protein